MIPYLLLNGLLAAEQKPNIILVMADDQGYGDVGFNGHPFLKTPHLDEMAKAGVVMDRFYAAAPVCSPTRASVMTGRHPMRTNVPNHGHYMRLNENTLAEGLKSAGYVTGHFGKWHIGSVQSESPTCPGKVGFDEWLTGLNFFDNDPYLSDNGTYKQLKGKGTVLTMDATLEFLKKHKDGGKPMFAVTWFPSPHDPHAELPEAMTENLYKEAGKNRGYYLEIALIDEQVGRLRKELRNLEIEENTILWYCSDNGGLVEKYSGGRAMKGSIYEGGLRVPSIMEWPAKLTPRVSHIPMTTSCMYPTLMKIAGAKIPDARPLDGIDRFKNIKNIVESPGSRPMGFWHHYMRGDSTWSDIIIKKLMEAQQQGEQSPLPGRVLKNVLDFPERKSRGLRGHAAWNDWPWKLHRIEKKKGEVVIELYNLQKDPMEKMDLAEQDPERVKMMRASLESWQHSVLNSWEGKDYPELPELKRR
ncbi:MAG: arylsulfatase A-like enzyme [Rubritalea sp.]|jgi:arylsulfatase A-like enzyme